MDKTLSKVLLALLTIIIVMMGWNIFVGQAETNGGKENKLIEDRRIAEIRDAEERRISEIQIKAMNMIDLHVSDLKGVLRALEEIIGTTGSSGHEQVISLADEILVLTQKMRLETADLMREDIRVLKPFFERIQHLAHELEAGARGNNHEEVHHAYENMVVELEGLIAEIAITRSNL